MQRSDCGSIWFTVNQFVLRHWKATKNLSKCLLVEFWIWVFSITKQACWPHDCHFRWFHGWEKRTRTTDVILYFNDSKKSFKSKEREENILYVKHLIYTFFQVICFPPHTLHVCGGNLITGLISAASPRVDISIKCNVRQKLGVSLPLLTCCTSAWPSRLLYSIGRKSRRYLWIILYYMYYWIAVTR
jgi:hypothetical protein